MNNNIVELKNISKSYDDTEILNNLNLSVKRNEFLTLLGPSGCGKTTTLRIIGGFEQPTSGNVLFEGKDITLLPPYKRKVNTVFQKYALFPHLNVKENIAFGLKVKKMSKNKIDQKVKQVLKLVNLEQFENRNINSLSGGQQQRIAIARAIVNEPEILLLDEPLGALDLKMRQEMQIELKKMQRQLGITFIYVTHDQEEALTMSDKIIVMNNGIVQQIGTPEDIYNEPKNAFIADFIGESNIFTGHMLKDCLVEFFDTHWKCVDKGFNENEIVDIVIRPEDVEISAPSDGNIIATVTNVTFKGVHYEMIADICGVSWKIHNTKMYSIGTQIGINIIPFNIHIMKKEVSN